MATSSDELTSPPPHPFTNPIIVGLVVFGGVVVVALVVALGMVAMRPTVNIADDGGKIDNSPSAKVEVSR